MANEFKKITELEKATSVSDTDLFIVETSIGTKAVDIGTFRGEAATAESIGLGNVDNTADLDKPISTATQTALDLKANTADLPATYLKIEDANNSYPTKVYTDETYLTKTNAASTYVTQSVFNSTLSDIETLLQGV